MKITVLGLGGVGGYIGALLADTYEDVTFVVRGERGKRIAEEGLLLHSDYRGERLVHPKQVVESAAELPVQDYVFLCVKNYSLQEACETLSGCVDEHTVVVPVMNGADPGERVREYLGKGIVLDSLIYIVAFRDGMEIVQQGNFANVRMGKKEPMAAEQICIEETAALLNQAGVDCRAEEDIEAAIWRKYMLNCAYSVATAYYNEPIGPLRADEKKSAQYEALVLEALTVAQAKGVKVNTRDTNYIIWRFYYDHAENASSSLQRDMDAKHQSELETFCGYLVREAERLNVLVPVMKKMYEEMKAREAAYLQES